MTDSKRTLQIFACTLALIAGLASAPTTWASIESVPRTLNYQGFLADAGGNALTGTRAMRFGLYLGATRVWYAEYSSVAVTAGFFSVELGGTAQGGAPLDPTTGTGSQPASLLPVKAMLFAGTDSLTSVELEIEVYNGSAYETLSPRVRKTSALFALKADTIDGYDSSSLAKLGATGQLLASDGTAVVDATGNWIGPNSGLVGPSGPAGAAGANGATGPQGAAGATGPQGTPGANGSTGAAGLAGAPGANGAVGATGPQGSAGANGAVGATGAIGATGAQGPVGAAGATGAQGLAGPAGTNGTNGTNGAVGATGAQGPAGANGTNGAVGATGAQGPAGANGTNGAVGATGAQGPAGANGTNGTNGAVGATGAQGPAGANGINGAVGATGAQGPAGANGTNGANGAVGATGLPGPAGAVGATGAPGANGTNGAVGATGANGSNGAVGATGAQGPAGTNGTNGVAGAMGATGPQGPAGTFTGLTSSQVTTSFSPIAAGSANAALAVRPVSGAAPGSLLFALDSVAGTTQLSVNAAGNLSTNGSLTSAAGLVVNGGGVTLPAGSITGAMIQDAGLTAAKLAPQAVTDGPQFKHVYANVNSLKVVADCGAGYVAISGGGDCLAGSRVMASCPCASAGCTSCEPSATPRQFWLNACNAANAANRAYATCVKL